jgi:hypothetical protein
VSLESRIRQLENRARPPWEGHVFVACVDDDGIVLACGLAAGSEWVGRHYTEMPAPVNAYHGFCGEEVVGRPRCEAHRRILGDES